MRRSRSRYALPTVQLVFLLLLTACSLMPAEQQKGRDLRQEKHRSLLRPPERVTHEIAQLRLRAPPQSKGLHKAGLCVANVTGVVGAGAFIICRLTHEIGTVGGTNEGIAKLVSQGLCISPAAAGSIAGAAVGLIWCGGTEVIRSRQDFEKKAGATYRSASSDDRIAADTSDAESSYCTMSPGLDHLGELLDAHDEYASSLGVQSYRGIFEMGAVIHAGSELWVYGTRTSKFAAAWVHPAARGQRPMSEILSILSASRGMGWRLVRCILDAYRGRDRLPVRAMPSEQSQDFWVEQGWRLNAEGVYSAVYGYDYPAYYWTFDLAVSAR